MSDTPDTSISTSNSTSSLEQTSSTSVQTDLDQYSTSNASTSGSSTKGSEVTLKRAGESDLPTEFVGGGFSGKRRKQSNYARDSKNGRGKGGRGGGRATGSNATSTSSSFYGSGRRGFSSNTSCSTQEGSEQVDQAAALVKARAEIVELKTQNASLTKQLHAQIDQIEKANEANNRLAAKLLKYEMEEEPVPDWEEEEETKSKIVEEEKQEM